MNCIIPLNININICALPNVHILDVPFCIKLLVISEEETTSVDKIQVTHLFANACLEYGQVDRLALPFYSA